MKSAHRTWHRRLWVVIGPLALLVLVFGVLTRPSLFPDGTGDSSTQEVTP